MLEKRFKVSPFHNYQVVDEPKNELNSPTFLDQEVWKMYPVDPKQEMARLFTFDDDPIELPDLEVNPPNPLFLGTKLMERYNLNREPLDALIIAGELIIILTLGYLAFFL